MKRLEAIELRQAVRIALGVLVLLVVQAVVNIIVAGLFWLLVLGGEDMPVWFSRLWAMLLVLVLAGLLTAGLIFVLMKGLKALAEYLEHRRILRTCRIEGHDWGGCTCRRCGKTRDEEHDWKGCKCRRCGKTRDEEHDWDRCICRRCGETRDDGHQWVVEICEQCGGTGYTGHSLSYGDPDYGDPDYPGNPCNCVKPRRTYCAICGQEKD